MSWATNKAKNSNKSKFVYNGYEMAFDWAIYGVLVTTLLKML